MLIKSKKWLPGVLIAVLASGVTGCSNDNDDDGFIGQITSLLIAKDLGSDQGEIERYTTVLNTPSGLNGPQQTFAGGLSEGIARDAAGNIYQAGINSTGTVNALCNLTSRADGAGFTAGTDRSLTTALTGPKGTAIAQKAGLIMVAENAAAENAVSVFSLTAANAPTTLFSIPRSVVGNTGAWDVAYDENSDRLFIALINGDIAYFNNYLANATNGPGSLLSPALTPTAVFRPDNPLMATNMHGIVYVADDDRLIVSDVGSAMVDDDGSLYVFESASTLTGTVTASRTLRGPATLLGNPVDLQLQSNDLIVAEKANAGGQILIFRNIATGSSGNVAPDASYALPAPESLVAAGLFGDIDADISDLTGQPISNLYVTRNAAMDATEILLVDTSLDVTGKTFTAVQAGQFIESISLDQNGDALVSFDDAGTPSAGGLSFINRLSQRSNGSSFTASRDRQTVGANTTLVSPKGIEIVGRRGLVLVADLNAAAPGAVKAFSLCANGNIAPAFSTTLPAGTRPWDLDYDPLADRLYVASTDGTILVYDNYLDNTPALPDRVIDPDDQSGIMASNIHGIVHDAATNRLIVSDVGDAASASDGRIYVIDNAATAHGLTPLRLELAGAATALGNPVDLAFDGNNLYVAEKSNDQVQRIDNLYALSGLMNVPPSDSLAFSKPESIALSPDFLPAP